MKNPIETALRNRELSGNLSASFISIKTRTDARAKKTGNPYGKIFKTFEGVAALNNEYQNNVRAMLKKLLADKANREKNRELIAQAREIISAARGLPWGNWETLPSGKRSKVFIQHKGEIYVRMRFFDSDSPGITRYFAEDGTELTREQAAPFLPARPDAPVIVRTFKLESIESIKIDGKTISKGAGE